MRRSVRALVFWAAALGALSGAAREAAAQGNPRSTPIGGRAVLMGGAAVALGRDGAAPFINPATIVRTDDATLAFSVNLWRWRQFTVKDWYRPEPADPRFGGLPGGDASLRDSSFDVLPSTLCLFLPALGGARLHAGRHKLGACLGTIESDELTFTSETYSPIGGTRPRELESLQRSWRRLEVAPTYSVQITDELAAGASLVGMFGTFRSVTNAASTSFAANFTGTSLYSAAEGTSLDLSGIVGATYRAGAETLGVSFRFPSAHIQGAGSFNDFRQVTGVGEAVVARDAQGRFSAPSPARFVIGSGTEFSWGSLEVDLAYVFQRTAAQFAYTGVERGNATGTATENALTINRTESARGVFGVSVGSEIFLSQKFGVLTGATTDLSAVPSNGLSDTPGSFFQARMHRLGLSLGLAHYSESTELMFGSEVSYGWGQTLVPDAYQVPPRFAIADLESTRVVFVLAGTTSLRALKRTVDDAAELPRELEKK
jgi:hypothetical protein